MKQQMSFAQSESAGKKKVTRRERFLGEMERVVPWARLCAVIEPPYPQGRRGRPPIGIERMLRIHFLQQWDALADEALEDALYDSQALRTFAGIGLSVEAVPDATTEEAEGNSGGGWTGEPLLKFRHLLEEHDLTRQIFSAVGALLSERKLLMQEGTIVDATSIAAPSSTKNARKERDPQMHQTKKGHQWYFGMKAPIGVDAQSGLVHRVTGTAAHVADIAQTHVLLHGEEQVASADAGYLGVEKREKIAAGHAGVEWHVAAKRGKIKAMAEGLAKEMAPQVERLKAQVRARVEHPFHIPQEPLSTSQDALSRAGQEHRAAPQPFCAGQPLHRPPLAAVPCERVSAQRKKRRELAGITSNQPLPASTLPSFLPTRPPPRRTCR